MKFQAAHKVMSYLLVASAVATMAAAEALAARGAATLLLAAALSWRFEPGTRSARVVDRIEPLTRILVVGFSLLSAWQARGTFAEGDPTPVLNMVLVLLGYKLFYRRTNRDYLHVYVLSFLLVLAAAVLAQSILFAAGFVLYVVLATWALILFHLRREMEENYLVKHSQSAPSEKVEIDRVLNSRRVVGRSFFAATGVVALGICAGAAATFAIVPRVGAGFLFGGTRKGRSVIGFSDRVVLGHHGVLSGDNETVVLRAQVPRIEAMTSGAARQRAISMLYWRGTIYDSYVDGQWERSRLDRLRTKLRPVGPVSLVIDPQATPPKGGHMAAALATDRQEIDLVALTHPVAFALDRPRAYEALPARPGAATSLVFDRRWSGEVGLRLVRRFVAPGRRDELADFSGARYVAYSEDPMAHPNPSAGVPLDDLDSDAITPYLAVPPSLSPRVAALAREITSEQKTAAGKMLAIQQWLHRTHGYTTDLKRNSAVADPLEDFLFHQQAGHCEYFASAMTVLLRLAGVPSRYVNGFLGGEWNEISRHITVRDNRAHSWAEAYLGSFGWVRADATPPGNTAPEMSRLRQLLDSLQLLWSRWVVDYDLSRQLDLARRLQRRIGMERTADGQRRSFGLPSRQTVAYGAGVLGALYLCYRAARLVRSLAGRRRPTDALAARASLPVFRLYRKALDRLARRGLPRRASETPREFSQRVRAAEVRGSEALERLTDLYAAARYGDQSVAEGEVADLAARLASLGEPERRPPPRAVGHS